MPYRRRAPAWLKTKPEEVPCHNATILRPRETVHTHFSHGIKTLRTLLTRSVCAPPPADPVQDFGGRRLRTSDGSFSGMAILQVHIERGPGEVGPVVKLRVQRGH